MRDRQSIESDSSIEETNIRMEPKPNRKTKRPERFGETGALSDDEQQNSFEEMLADDSSDEFVIVNQYTGKNRIVESQKRKILHTVDGIGKKNKPSSHKNPQQSQFPWDENYDDEFDQLNSSIEKQLSICELNKSLKGENSNPKSFDQIFAQRKSTESIDKSTSVGLNLERDSDEKSTDRQRNSIGVSDSGTGTNMGINHSQSHANNGDTRNEYLNDIRDMLVEVLVRVKNLEKAQLTRGTLPTDDGINKTSFDEFHTFSKLNRLPLRNEDDLNEFENKLNDEEFREIAVSVKCMIIQPFSIILIDLMTRFHM